MKKILLLILFVFSFSFVFSEENEDNFLGKAVKDSQLAFKRCSDFLDLSEESELILRDIYTDIEIKKIRIKNDVELSNCSKDLKYLNLKFELDSRIRNITTRDEYKRYCEFKKILRKEKRVQDK